LEIEWDSVDQAESIEWLNGMSLGSGSISQGYDDARNGGRAEQRPPFVFISISISLLAADRLGCIDDDQIDIVSVLSGPPRYLL